MESAAFDQDELLALARHDVERGQIEPALGKLKRIIARPDCQPPAIALAARLYAQLGLMERAQALFEKYVALKPDALHETFELGMTYFDGGRADKAEEMWARVLKNQPTHPPALFYSGLAAARAGKAVEAKRSIDILLKSAPADNLYFSKGRDLLRDIDQGLPQTGLPPVANAAAHAAPGYFSKTEH